MTNNLEAIAAAFCKDHAHEIGLAVLVRHDESGHAYAVLDAASGRVIGWDGWYYDDSMPERHLGPLRELPEWDDRDMALSQAVLSRSLAWLPAFGSSLLPEFSLGSLSLRLLTYHGSAGDSDLPQDWHVAAYYPTGLSREEAVERASH